MTTYLETVDVLIITPVYKTFKYACNIKVPFGTIVSVPVSNRVQLGVVWNKNIGIVKSNILLKQVTKIYDNLNCFSLEHIKFIEIFANYYVIPIGWALNLSLPIKDNGLIPETIRALNFIYQPKHAEEILSPKTLELYNKIKLLPNLRSVDWHKNGYSNHLQNKLIKSGFAKWQNISKPFWKAPQLNLKIKGAILNEEQNQAAEKLKISLDNNKFKTLVLDGVTGSGKTEVYLEAITHCLKQGKQVLVLMPEIGLTSSWYDRCCKRYDCPPVLWHSQLTKGVRKKNWHSILEGTAKLILGARSSLFLPFKNLGLLIVDEEHDSSYKNHDGVPYHARDMAVLICKTHNCPCCLVSATPSLETVQNISQNKYIHLILNKRFSGVDMPKVNLIDMSLQSIKEKGNNKNSDSNIISSALKQKVTNVLNKNNQILLFLNKRGFAPVLICNDCGYRFVCPHCDQGLVLHLQNNRMICHYCGYEQFQIMICLKCRKNNISKYGFGVEKLYQVAKNIWKQAKIRIVTSDYLVGFKAYHELIEDIKNKNIDILIGTQILAKGYHFPNLQLVSIIDGDSFGCSDFRLNEKHFQMLQQVSGRAGREKERGEILIQTWNKNSNVLNALVSQKRDDFIKQELVIRKSHDWPPYTRLMAIIILGKIDYEVSEFAKILVKYAPDRKIIRILGPAPAYVLRFNDIWRYRILVITPKNYSRQTLWKKWYAKAPKAEGIKLRIDMDPYNFD